MTPRFWAIYLSVVVSGFLWFWLVNYLVERSNRQAQARLLKHAREALPLLQQMRVELFACEPGFDDDDLASGDEYASEDHGERLRLETALRFPRVH